MRRQLGLGSLALPHDDRIRLLAQTVELGGAARRQAVLPLKPERHAEIHQLDDGQIKAGVLPHLREQLEEAFAGDGSLVEERYQRVGVPHAGAAPGCVEHDVVDARAKRVVSRRQQLARQVEIAHALLEIVHRPHRALAQFAGVRRIDRIGQPRHQLQQRRGRADKRVDPHRDGFGALADARRRGRLDGSALPAVGAPVIGVPGRGAAGAAAAADLPPGLGRIIVRSLSSGSRKGLSLMAAR